MTEFRLDSIYRPDPPPGEIDMVLRNLSSATVTDFTLSWSSLTRLRPEGVVKGARFQRRLGNLHTVACPVDLLPGDMWRFTLSGLSHVPKHRLDGPKSGYVTLQSGEIIPVDVSDMTSSAAAPGPVRSLPSGRVEQPLGVIPWPKHVAIEQYADVAPISPTAATAADEIAAMERVGALSQRLFPEKPNPFETRPVAGTVIRFRTEPHATGGYTLNFDNAEITLATSDPAGRDYGLITLAQMAMAAQQPGYQFPTKGKITDAARFDWRGTHLDVVRHFWPKPDILRLIDILAWHKMNRFHWHLTDDEGWRIEIKAFPELTDIAAARGPHEALVGQGGFTGQRYGGFYTQADATEIIVHAEMHHIQIVPEIDIPGHSHATLTALPHLRDPDEPADSYRSIQGYGNNALNPGVPETYDFLETVIDEIAVLFPCEYIHIGGDEVAEAAWMASPAAQTLNLPDTAALQSHLLTRVRDMIVARGKKMAGWDEVSHGGGVKGTLINAWQTSELTAKLIRAGYDVVACPGQAYYLDMAQADGWDEPGLSWAGTVSPETTYDYDPTAGLTGQEAAQLMGIQACIWSENLTSSALFNHMVFPRLSAVAETAWSNERAKDWLRFVAISRLMPRL